MSETLSENPQKRSLRFAVEPLTELTTGSENQQPFCQLIFHWLQGNWGGPACKAIGGPPGYAYAARPGCHHFGVTPYYDVKPQLHRFVVNTFLFFTLYLFGQKITDFREDQIVLDRKPSHFAAKTFFFCCFSLHIVLIRKRVPPRNPSPGATILSNASAKLFARFSFIS